MAVFRKIHVTFWSDSFVSNLTDKEKLFYLYLLTNSKTSQLGVYEITKKQISFDLGYSIDTVSNLIKSIEKTDKIRYNEITCEMAIKNWYKYNGNSSIKVKSLTDKESQNIKDKSLIEYIYSIDTVSVLYPPKEEEEEQEKEQTENKILDDFDLLLVDWFQYKKDKRQSYKSDKSKLACKNKLINLSNNNTKLAAQIIEQSMANNWDGLFDLKVVTSKLNHQPPTQSPQLPFIKPKSN